MDYVCNNLILIHDSVARVVQSRATSLASIMSRDCSFSNPDYYNYRAVAGSTRSARRHIGSCVLYIEHTEFY